MGVFSKIADTALGLSTAPATGLAGTIVGAVSKVADKIWVDADTKATNLALIAKATLEAESAGELAEYQAEMARWTDIRESGWLSRQVRPVIALTFHGFFWYFLLCRTEDFKETIGVVIFSWSSLDVTVGAMYVMIVAFYFLTKGIKDYFISKNPSGINRH